ncbi:MAG: O-antigen ligase family protein [candidate division WOR-3 bacterium]
MKKLILTFLFYILIYSLFIYLLYDLNIKIILKIIISISFLILLFLTKSFSLSFLILSPLFLTFLLRLFLKVPEYFIPTISITIIDFFSFFYLFKLFYLNFKLKTKENFSPFLISFLFLILFSLLFSKNAKYTLIMFLFILSVFIYYIALVNEITELNKIYLFIFFISIFSLFNSFIGFLQWKGKAIVILGEFLTKLPTGSFFGATRVRGILSHMNSYPAILAFLNPIFLSVLFSNAQKYIKLSCILAIIFSIPGIIFSLSRAGYICLITGFLSFFFLYLIKEKSKEEIIKILTLLLLAVLIFLSIIFIIPQVKMRIINTITFTKDISARVRFYLWKNSVKTFFEKPLGIGWGNFIYQPYSLGLWRPHNLYIHLMIELGIGGIILFLFFSFFLIKKLYLKFKMVKEKDLKFLLFGIISSWIIFLIHNIFESIWIPYYHNLESYTFAWLLFLTNFLINK